MSASPGKSSQKLTQRVHVANGNTGSESVATEETLLSTANDTVKTAPALVIQDVDLGKDSFNDYEVIKAIKRLPLPTTTSISLPEFAVVDDSTLVLKAWQRKFKGKATVHTFESLDAFRRAQSADGSFLSRLSFVLTNLYFATCMTNASLSFKQKLKISFPKPIFISSDGKFNTTDLAGCMEGVIPKDPISWT